MTKQALYLTAVATLMATPGNGEDCSTILGSNLNLREAPYCGRLVCDKISNNDIALSNFAGNFEIPATNFTEFPPGCDLSNSFDPVQIVFDITSGGVFTGDIPTNFGTHFQGAVDLDLSGNKITGGLENLGGSGSLIRALNLNDNLITDTVSDLVNGFPAQCSSVKLAGNSIAGNYDDAALKSLLEGAENLSEFSIEMAPGTSCVDLDAINAQRQVEGFTNLIISRDDPSRANCDTPSPTPPPQTFEPTPPTNIPTQSPITPEPTDNPTPKPTVSPTDAPTTSSPTQPTPFPTRSSASSTMFSVSLLLGAVSAALNL
mmetsp:Transcript_14136/g.31291  ORF Transcript_14136/g.31291 Transcript_14136/m.31291 type:complete len:317 (+) Transcript_14136:97-1047(+)